MAGPRRERRMATAEGEARVDPRWIIAPTPAWWHYDGVWRRAFATGLWGWRFGMGALSAGIWFILSTLGATEATAAALTCLVVLLVSVEATGSAIAYTSWCGVARATADVWWSDDAITIDRTACRLVVRGGLVRRVVTTRAAVGVVVLPGWQFICIPSSVFASEEQRWDLLRVAASLQHRAARPPEVAAVLALLATNDYDAVIEQAQPLLERDDVDLWRDERAQVERALVLSLAR